MRPKSDWNLRSALTISLSALATVTQAQDASSSRASNDSLLWGPYRPNLYFGVRPRLPKSLLTGLMWGRVEDFTSVQSNIRHTCEQHEGMAGYGWDAYDPRTGGVQTIRDAGNGLDVTTSFVKLVGRGAPGSGGSWGVRVAGVPREGEGSGDMKTAVWFYAAMEGLGSLEVEGAGESGAGFAAEVLLAGQTTDLGEFTLEVTAGENTYPVHAHPSYRDKPLDRTLVESVQIPEEALWQAKAALFTSLKQTIDGYVKVYGTETMPPPWQTYTIQHQPGQGNLHLIQKVFEGPFEFDIIYSSGSADSPVTSDDLTQAIKTTTSAFSARFLAAMEPAAPFTASKYLAFSKSLFSNLIGGIGYFHGDSLVDRSYAPEYDEEDEGFWQGTAEARERNAQALEGPYSLFTSIPSRTFFPRGFLWDEGFHLLPILDWDAALALDIIKSWFALMDADGWIAREQILGPEARSKVPPEFTVQYPHYANPPTLFMVLEAFVRKLNSGSDSNSSGDSLLADPAAAKLVLRDLYPLLKKNYAWYRRTQWGDLKSYDRGPVASTREAYRWRGRSPSHILPSGLDDYPRPQPPHPGELHVDLLSWMGMMTRSLHDVAQYLNESDDAATFAKSLTAITSNLEDLHWDPAARMFCDASFDDYEEHARVCHAGYVAIFPFLTGLLGPLSARLGAVLDLIADEDELWSAFGIRSLGKSEALYGSGEDYWRGPVWINMNWLVVENLYAIATQAGPHAARAARLYGALRVNLVENVYRAWAETGFAWEQYSAETGAGQRTQHFTGWTSLVVKIMAMPEVVVKGGEGHDEL